MMPDMPMSASTILVIPLCYLMPFDSISKLLVVKKRAVAKSRMEASRLLEASYSFDFVFIIHMFKFIRLKRLDL